MRGEAIERAKLKQEAEDLKLAHKIHHELNETSHVDTSAQSNASDTSDSCYADHYWNKYGQTALQIVSSKRLKASDTYSIQDFVKVKLSNAEKKQQETQQHCKETHEPEQNQEVCESKVDKTNRAEEKETKVEPNMNQQTHNTEFTKIDDWVFENC